MISSPFWYFAYPKYFIEHDVFLDKFFKFTYTRSLSLLTKEVPLHSQVGFNLDISSRASTNLTNLHTANSKDLSQYWRNCVGSSLLIFCIYLPDVGCGWVDLYYISLYPWFYLEDILYVIFEYKLRYFRKHW